jgi:hypothetical protein
VMKCGLLKPVAAAHSCDNNRRDLIVVGATV